MRATSLSERAVAVQRYVALGDSFTAGAPGDEQPVRFPDELARLLEVANPDLEYHNLGVAGATTAEVAERQLEPCLALEPDLVTLVCGANDVLLSVRPDIDAHARRLAQMLDRLAARLPRAALVTATTPDLSSFSGLRPRSRRRVQTGIDRLNAATRAVARRHGAVVLEMGADPGAGDRSNFAVDGFHPSPIGARRAAHGCAGALAARYGISYDPGGDT